MDCHCLLVFVCRIMGLGKAWSRHLKRTRIPPTWPRLASPAGFFFAWSVEYTHAAWYHGINPAVTGAGYADECDRNSLPCRFSIQQTVSLCKKITGFAQIYGGDHAAGSFWFWCRCQSTALAMGKPDMGVVRATRGVRVPVCNPDSNFIFCRLSIWVWNERVGGVPARFRQKKTPAGTPGGVWNELFRGKRGIWVYFPVGLNPIV